MTSPALPDADNLPEGEEKAAAVQAMFDTIAPRYDFMNRLMTFRMDVGWRRKALAKLALPPGSTVMDLACGTGDLCRELADRGVRPIGVDFSFGMLANARTGAPLVQGDGLRLPFGDDALDGVTCGFALRNFVDLDQLFAELGRTVRPGGRIALLDVAEPPNRLMRFGHGLYFGKVVPFVGGVFSNKAAYAYLPKSVAYLPEPPELVAKVEAAGFANVERVLLSGGISQLITGTAA